jgi:hypothetical protein
LGHTRRHLARGESKRFADLMIVGTKRAGVLGRTVESRGRNEFVVDGAVERDELWLATYRSASYVLVLMRTIFGSSPHNSVGANPYTRNVLSHGVPCIEI